MAERLLVDCKRRQTQYLKIKNSSLRIRRTVLGEMKENKEGGFYFTKPFRTLMSAFTQAEDFLSFVLNEKERTYDYFFRQFVEFYRCARLVAGSGDKIFREACADLAALMETVDREIADLKRYRRKIGGVETLTYAERIDRREELKREISGIGLAIEEMAEGLELFGEFFAIVRLTGHSAELGKCKSSVDIARWLYRETVKKYKSKYGMKGAYPSDGYALCEVLSCVGRQLKPRYGLVFIDEGQDISEGEYRLLRHIHSDAAFNVFGDLKQNITPYRGIGNWDALDCNVYCLNQNYRNTNEIVDYVSEVLHEDMRSIGLGGEAVKHVRLRGVTGFFRAKEGSRAIIAKEEYLPLLAKRGCNLLSQSGKISKTKINVMSVYESKGLEFSVVAVYDKDMTDNEKYIAYTRALGELAIISDDITEKRS